MELLRRPVRRCTAVRSSSSTETIKAIAGYAGITNSVTGSATYTISPSAPTIDEWNWAGGSSTFWNSAEGNCFANYYCGQPGVYGTLGAAAAGNLPGGREEGATWTDSKGNLWLFGGYGVVNNLNEVEYLNDLWKFSPSTKEWTWVSGSDTLYATGGGCIVGSTSGRQNNCGQPGVYGKLGVPAARNVPGGREFSANGSIVKAISGFLADMESTRTTVWANSMTFGNSIPPPPAGPGSRAAIQLCMTEISTLANPVIRHPWRGCCR